VGTFAFSQLARRSTGDTALLYYAATSVKERVLSDQEQNVLSL
jgi:hypothetical protein